MFLLEIPQQVFFLLAHSCVQFLAFGIQEINVYFSNLNLVVLDDLVELKLAVVLFS